MMQGCHAITREQHTIQGHPGNKHVQNAAADSAQETVTFYQTFLPLLRTCVDFLHSSLIGGVGGEEVGLEVARLAEKFECLC